MTKRRFEGKVISYNRGEVRVQIGERKLFFDVSEVTLPQYGDYVVKHVFEGEAIVVETEEDGSIMIQIPVLDAYWDLVNRMKSLIGSRSVQDAKMLQQLFEEYKQQQHVLGEQRYGGLASRHKRLTTLVREYLKITPSAHNRLNGMDVTTIRPKVAYSIAQSIMSQPVATLGQVLVLEAVQVCIRYILEHRADYDLGTGVDLRVTLEETKERLEKVYQDGFEQRQEQWERPLASDVLEPGATREAVCTKWRRDFGIITWYEDGVPVECRVHYKNVFLPEGRFGDRKLSEGEKVFVTVDLDGEVKVTLADVEEFITLMQQLQPFLAKKLVADAEKQELRRLLDEVNTIFERIHPERRKKLHFIQWHHNATQRGEAILHRS